MCDFITTFKNTNFTDRKEQALQMLNKYPERCPIIVYKDKNSTLNNFKVNKFLVPRNFTFSQFIHTIKNKNNLDPKIALFAFINNNIPTSSENIASIYKKHKDDDYYLYVKILTENTFG